jgi:hypothetical protein
MKTDKIARLTAELETANRRNAELSAQLASACGNAWESLPAAGSKFHGSAIILTITALGGREVVAPFAIRDGLSVRAVEALRDDAARSFELATLVNPGMARANDMGGK